MRNVEQKPVGKIPKREANREIINRFLLIVSKVLTSLIIFLIFPPVITASSSGIVLPFGQNYNSCGTVFNPYLKISNPFRGLYKPVRTDLSGDEPAPDSAYFPVLIVFVQFKNDVDLPAWHTNEPPVFIDSMISPVKRVSDEWWNAYDEKKESFSDYFMELSGGRFHLAGKAYSVVLDNEADYYYSLGNIDGERAINKEVIEKLNSVNDFSWQDYDLWKDSIVNDEQRFYYQPDSIVDMIFKIHKTTGGVLFARDGYSSLSYYSGSGFFEADTVNHIKIHTGYGMRGSGLTVIGLRIKTRILLTSIHEFGHYLYANGHITYGRIVYGAGTEGFFSPYEMIVLGYMEPSVADLNSGNTFELNDYSSRENSRGNILQIPVQGNESFILAHRGWISTWDKMMLGDTAQIDPINISTNYGKGLYIYHIKDGITIPFGDVIPQDLECADGFWKWKYGGKAHRYSHDAGHCYDAGLWDYYLRDEVRYENDANNYFTVPQDSLGDGISFFRATWAGIGEVQQDPCQPGINRVFTNSTDIYAIDEQWGDRWDAWNVGYNEVFSPYSSPSSNTWNTNPTNQNSGIFIWYRAFDTVNKAAFIEIYRTGYNGLSEDSILKITPPSRPMGLKIELTDCIQGRRFPKITWNHNSEPDMIFSRGYPQANYKRYKIYRADSEHSNVPGDYYEIADIYLNCPESPFFIDSNAYVPCESNELFFNCRYKIKAIDNYGWQSVYSDFVYFPAYY